MRASLSREPAGRSRKSFQPPPSGVPARQVYVWPIQQIKQLNRFNKGFFPQWNAAGKNATVLSSRLFFLKLQSTVLIFRGSDESWYVAICNLELATIMERGVGNLYVTARFVRQELQAPETQI
jgi:hypothetical protein